MNPENETDEPSSWTRLIAHVTVLVMSVCVMALVCTGTVTLIIKLVRWVSP